MAHDPNKWYPLLTAAALDTGLPWWLIYSVMEQESAFDPNSESCSGALGLMQLLPASFPAHTRGELLDPSRNVTIGSRFLRDCIAMWRHESSDEAVQFGLGSYNGGAGYILEAQRLAGLAGEDTAQWAAVQPWLASAMLNGKRPDVEEITDYVRTIWRKFSARRGQPVPGTGDAA